MEKNATVRITENDDAHEYASPAYLAVDAAVAGEPLRFLLTPAEALAAMERAAAQPEEFADTDPESPMQLAQFWTAVGKRVGRPRDTPPGPPEEPPPPPPTPSQPEYLVASYVDAVTGVGLFDDPDLTTDQADPLMRMLLAIPDARTIVFPEGWTIRADNVTVVPPKRFWVVEGNGTTIVRTLSGRVVDENGDTVFLAPRDGDPDVYRDPATGRFLWTDSLTGFEWRVKDGAWQRPDPANAGKWLKLGPAYPKPTVPFPVFHPIGHADYSAIENVRASDFWQRWPRRMKHLVFEGCESLTVRDLHVRGIHTIPDGNQNTPGAYIEVLEGQHAFEFIGCTDVVVDGASADAVYGDLVYLGALKLYHHADGRVIRTYDRRFHWYDNDFHALLPEGAITDRIRWTERIDIGNGDFRRAGRQGVALTGVRGLRFHHNYIGMVDRSLLDNEPNNESEGTIGATFDFNTFGPAGNTTFAAHGAKGYCDGIVISDNVLDGNKLSIIYNDDPPTYPAADTEHGPLHEGLTVERNTSLDDSADPPVPFVLVSQPIPAMRVFYTRGVVVRDNKIAFQPNRQEPGARWLVQYGNCCDVDIGGNVLAGGRGELRPAQPEAGYAGPTHHETCPGGAS